MIRIDRLRLRLPRGFEHRASSIALLVGESLARFEAAESGAIDRISVGPLAVAPNATDQDVAQQIASGITGSLGGKQ